MSTKVFVTRKIPEEGLDILRKGVDELSINPDDNNLDKRGLIEKISDIDGLLCMLSDPIDKEVIASAPKLKVIATYAVGYNNIDITEAKRRGIPVCNTPGVLTDATADIAWALLMACARRIVEGDEMTRKGEFKGWAPMLLLGSDIVGKTLGIIGAGRIGTAMALRSKGFNMKALYCSRHHNEVIESQLDAIKVDKGTLLRESDYISLHVPLTDETKHYISEREFEMMKKTAFLINTARGPVIDESALVEALQSGRIAGAGLDVYEKEPEIHNGLTALKNVVLAPHLGSATVKTRTKMAIMASEDLVAVLKGNRPKNCVNPEVFRS